MKQVTFIVVTFVTLFLVSVSCFYYYQNAANAADAAAVSAAASAASAAEAAVPGKDGLNGKDGTNGAPGTNGIDGTNGTDGKDGTNAMEMAQLLIVQKTPDVNQFASVNSALASISDNASTKRYTIWVGPGTYMESQIQMKPFVQLMGMVGSTVLAPSNPAIPFILGANFTSIQNLTLAGVTSSSAIQFIDAANDTPNAPLFLSQVTFQNNQKHVDVQVTSKTTTMIMFNCASSGTCGTYLSVQCTNPAKVAGVACFNCLWSSTSAPTDGAYVTGTGAFITSEGGALNNTNSIAGGNGFHVRDGGLIRTMGARVTGFAKALWSENAGSAPTLLAASTMCDTNTKDLMVDHPGTLGSFTGDADLSKVFVDDAAVGFSSLYNDPTGAGSVVLGELYLGPRPSALTEVSSLIFDGSTMGVISGGKMTVDSGLDIQVKAGTGYAIVPGNPDSAVQVKWVDSIITLPASSTSYVFVKDDGSFNAALSQPNMLQTIILGRVATNATDVLWIDQSEWNAAHASNQLDNYNRTAFGAVYVSGSMITTNGTNKIDVAQGEYFLSQNQFSPSGGTQVNLIQYYHDSPTTWTQISSDTVQEKYNDIASGTLKDLDAGNYTRHSIYVVGDGGNEHYLLVFGSKEYASEALALTSDLPLPPPDFIEGIVLIGSLVVGKDEAAITKVVDNRPLVASRAQSIATTNLHGNLLGLAADDHKQYLLVNGTRAMSGDLDMGTFNVVNAGTYNGVTVEAHAARHLPNGADPIASASAVSLTSASTNTTGVANSFARSDHTHQITGFLTTLANEGTGTGKVFDALSSSTANLRSLLQDATAGKEGIEITTGATDITIGNTLSASNLGTGQTLFTSRTTGANPRLQLKSILPDTGLFTSSTANEVSIGIDDTGVTAGDYSFAAITVNAQGQITAADTSAFVNVGSGTGDVFRDIVTNSANFRRLLADAASGKEGIEIATVGDDVVIGNTLTAVNIGNVSTGLFKTRTAAAVLQFKSILASTGVTVTSTATDITIAVTNTAVTAGTYNFATVTVNAQGQITAASSGTFANVGGGSGVFRDTSPASTANFKSLIGGTGVTVTSNADDLTLSLTDTAVTPASYVFTALSVNAKGQLTAASSGSFSNVGTGSGKMFRDLSPASQANFKSLLAGTGMTVTNGTDDVTVAITNTAVTGGTYNFTTFTVNAQGQLTAASTGTFANSGAGEGVFRDTSGSTANFKSLSGDVGVSVYSDADNVIVTLDDTAVTPGTYNFTTFTVDAQGRLTAASTGSFANVGTGSGVFRNTSPGSTANFKSLNGDSGVTVTTNTDDITIALAATTVTPASYVFTALTVNDQGQLTAASSGSFANVGTGSGVFRDTSPASVANFKSLIASTGLSLTSNANDLTLLLANTAVVAATYNFGTFTVDAQGRLTAASTGGFANVGTGSGVFRDTSPASTANFKSVIGTTGVTVTSNADDLTLSLSNTAVTPASYAFTALTVNAQGQLTAASSGSFANVGTGSGVFRDTSPASTANFKSLIASTGLNVTSNANDLTMALADTAVTAATYNFGTFTVDAQGRLTAASTSTFANVGTGSGVFRDTSPASTANFKSLIASTGLTITSNPNDLTLALDNTAVVAATYNFTTLTVDAQGRLTAASTGSFANVGAGSGIFRDTSPASTANFKSIIASTGLSVTSNANDLSLALANTAVTAGSYTFTNLTVDAQGRITTAANGGFGNTIRVDAVNGTASGALNGAPFATISQAIAIAASGQLIEVGPGTYTEKFTIPAGVSVVGKDINTVIIQQLNGNIAANTDIVTVGVGSSLQNVTVNGTSTGNFQIRGVVLSSTNTPTLLMNVNITMSGAGNGTNFTTGVYSSSNANPSTQTYCAVNNVTVSATSSGTGPVRALHYDASGNLNTKNFVGRATSSGGGVAIGAELTNGGVLSLTGGNLGGTPTNATNGDISQTSGSLVLTNVGLINSTTANGNGFLTRTSTTSRTFGETGTMTTAARYYYYGTSATTSTTEIGIRLPGNCICRGMTVQTVTAGTAGNNATWAVRKNQAATSQSITLTAPAFSTSNFTNCTSFSSFDELSLQGTTDGNGTNPIGIQVTLDFY